MNKIIELRDISFAYTNNLIFQDVSFSVNEGEFIAIVGENGTGKSTLMKIIIGELSSTSGEVFIENKENIGYVPQLSAATSTNFPITIREIFALNLRNEIKRFEIGRASCRERV